MGDPFDQLVTVDVSRRMSDGDKLRALADWFDVRDRQRGNTGDEVQCDLRRMARFMDGHAACDNDREQGDG